MLWSVALACVNSPPPPTPAITQPNIGTQNTENSLGLPDENCMNNCLRQNMARSVSAEVINTDCVSSCIGKTSPLLDELDPEPNP